MKDSWKFMRQILVSKKSRGFFRKYPEHEREIVEYFRDGGVDTFIVSRPILTGWHQYKFYMRGDTISCRDEWVANFYTDKWLTDINHPHYKNPRFWTDMDNLEYASHSQEDLFLRVTYHENINFDFSARDMTVKRVVTKETHGMPEGTQVINIKRKTVDAILNHHNSITL